MNANKREFLKECLKMLFQPETIPVTYMSLRGERSVLDEAIPVLMRRLLRKVRSQ